VTVREQLAVLMAFCTFVMNGISDTAVCHIVMFLLRLLPVVARASSMVLID
jgi:hypothetical protein